MIAFTFENGDKIQIPKIVTEKSQTIQDWINFSMDTDNVRDLYTHYPKKHIQVLFDIEEGTKQMSDFKVKEICHVLNVVNFLSLDLKKYTRYLADKISDWLNNKEGDHSEIEKELKEIGIVKNE